MKRKLEYLRQKLYSAIDAGNTIEILKASQELDVEIAKFMRLSLIQYKNKIDMYNNCNSEDENEI